MGEMMKTTRAFAGFIGMIAIGLLVVASSPAPAGETAYRFDPVTQKSRALVFKNTWAGYTVFKKNCKTCHFTDNGQGASFLHTESKNMRGWKRVFLTKYPVCAQQGSWNELPQDELLQRILVGDVAGDDPQVEAQKQSDPDFAP